MEGYSKRRYAHYYYRYSIGSTKLYARMEGAETIYPLLTATECRANAKSRGMVPRFHEWKKGKL